MMICPDHGFNLPCPQCAENLKVRIVGTATPNTKLIEAAEKALDNMAFILNHFSVPDNWFQKFDKELAEGRSALSEAKQPAEQQGEQEPVAWATMYSGEVSQLFKGHDAEYNAKREIQRLNFEYPNDKEKRNATALYTHPELVKAEPLTQDQILDMAEGCTLQFHDLLAFARAIEAAHGIVQQEGE